MLWANCKLAPSLLEEEERRRKKRGGGRGGGVYSLLEEEERRTKGWWSVFVITQGERERGRGRKIEEDKKSSRPRLTIWGIS